MKRKRISLSMTEEVPAVVPIVFVLAEDNDLRPIIVSCVRQAGGLPLALEDYDDAAKLLQFYPPVMCIVDPENLVGYEERFFQSFTGKTICLTDGTKRLSVKPTAEMMKPVHPGSLISVINALLP